MAVRAGSRLRTATRLSGSRCAASSGACVHRKPVPNPAVTVLTAAIRVGTAVDSTTPPPSSSSNARLRSRTAPDWAARSTTPVDAVKPGLRGLHGAEPAVESAEQAEGESGTAAAQAGDVALQLRPDDREVPQRRLFQLVPQVGVGLQEESRRTVPYLPAGLVAARFGFGAAVPGKVDT
jgi:hypothetical protein